MKEPRKDTGEAGSSMKHAFVYLRSSKENNGGLATNQVIRSSDPD